MSDAQAPAPAPAAPDLAGAGNEPAPVTAPAPDAPIDLTTAEADPASKIGRELAAARQKYGKIMNLDPAMQKAILALVDGVAAGDADAVTNWLEQSLVSYAGPDRVTQIAQRYGQTSAPIGQDGRPTTPAVPAPTDDAPLTAAQIKSILDQRDQAQQQRTQAEQQAAWEAQVAAERQVIAEEVFTLGLDPDGPFGQSLVHFAAVKSKEQDRYVAPKDVFEEWKASGRAIFDPATVPTPGPSAVAPNGAPAANPMADMSPRDRVMARIQRNAGVGGPA
jgi:hypothetical protein